MSNIGPGFGPEDDGTGVPGSPVPPPPPPPPPPPAPDAYEPDPPLPRAGSRKAPASKTRQARGCLPMVLVLVVIVAGLWFGGGWAVDKVKSLTGSTPDYSSTNTKPGKNAVTVEVRSGDNAGAIGRTLKSAGVVKSVDAFVKAAAADDRSRGIQVGFYLMNKELKASAALAVLVNPDNLIQATVTIPEGFRLNQIVDRLVAKTDFSKKQIDAAMGDPAALGLPAEAKGNLQGYLFPATYTILPGATAKSLLTQMVDKTKAVEKSLGTKAKAEALGLTPHEVLTVASILEYEAGRDADYPKVARVLYNRLDDGMALQLDSTVAFANNSTGSIYTTAEERAVDSPYNTYKYSGLPPGPIGAAGEKAIKAALNPAVGNWLYFVLINPETGETRFNTTLAGHNADDALFDKYCREHEGAC